MSMKTFELTKKLISIPSYVDGKVDESEVGELVYQYLKQFKWLKIKKQYISQKRFNIIATDNYPTKLILCGHLDTVQPRGGWQTNPLLPVVKANKLYGLGASDMKGNIAAMLSALNRFDSTKGLMLFFYVDEEYDFLGMKKFIDEYKGKISPELIISGDGSELKIGNGCRGLIEITFLVKGISGHAGKPDSGKNAILISAQAVDRFKDLLKKKYKDNLLGESTCNLAFIQGGLDLRARKDPELIIGREGNNIADICEFVIDVRPANENLNAKKVVKFISQFIQIGGGKIENYKIRHDFGCWITSPKELTSVKKALDKVAKAEYAKLGSFGYIDTQMLWQTFKGVPCLTIGAGEKGTAHSPNEYISIPKLEKLSKVLVELIHQFGKGGVKND